MRTSALRPLGSTLLFALLLVAALPGCVSQTLDLSGISHCASQTLDLSGISQVSPQNGADLEHFRESSYSVYMLFDLIDVSPAHVGEMMRRANPENRPVANLKIISRADVWATLLNILNGGLMDRGIIVSLNKVTIEGDMVRGVRKEGGDTSAAKQLE